MEQKHITTRKPSHLSVVGMKVTHARDEILHYVKQKDTPVAVDEIMAFLQSVKCNTNKVTIYRTLDAFVKKGMMRKLEFQEGKFRYEIYTDDHHHLICTTCGNIDAVSDTFMQAIQKQIEKEKHFSVEHHTLEFYGKCRSCL